MTIGDELGCNGRAMRKIIAGTVLLIALAAPTRAGWDEGLAAYNRGDYATALREWRPIAEQGDFRAQAILGVGHRPDLNQIVGAAADLQHGDAAVGYGLPELSFAMEEPMR